MKRRVAALPTQQLEKVRKLIGPAHYDSGKFYVAVRMFEEMSTSDGFPTSCHCARFMD